MTNRDKNARHKKAIGAFFNTPAGRSALNEYLKPMVNANTNDLTHENLACREGKRSIIWIFEQHADLAAKEYGDDNGVDES